MTAPPEPAGLPRHLRGLGRTVVMGVLNVTPDSFSDGGRWLDPRAAVQHGLDLTEQGADLVDVGGESTRPGAVRLDPEAEQARVLPVVKALVASGVTVSIDTMHAGTALLAVEAGAAMVNDVSGGLADPEMMRTVADLGTTYVCMHWRGFGAEMGALAVYADVVRDVRSELRQRLEVGCAVGLDPARVVIDPGLGFAKEASHNWALLHGIDELAALGRPLLVGASRKRFLGALLADPESGEPRPLDQRDAATDAVTAIAASRGVWGVRVHDVRGSRDAVAVAGAWREGGR